MHTRLSQRCTLFGNWFIAVSISLFYFFFSFLFPSLSLSVVAFISFRFFPFAVQTREKKEVKSNKKKPASKPSHRYLTILFKVEWVYVKCQSKNMSFLLISILIGIKQKYACVVLMAIAWRKKKQRISSWRPKWNEIISFSAFTHHDHRYSIVRWFYPPSGYTNSRFQKKNRFVFVYFCHAHCSKAYEKRNF